MAKQKSRSFTFRAYVQVGLPGFDAEEIQAYVTENKDYAAAIESFITDGYSVTISYDKDYARYSLALIQKNENDEDCGYGFYTNGPTVAGVITVALLKLHHLKEKKIKLHSLNTPATGLYS